MTADARSHLPGLNPVTKLIVLVTISVFVLLASSPLTMLLIVASVLAAKQWFGTKGRFTKGVIGFASAIFIAQILFNHSGETMVSLWLISVTEGGVNSGVAIAGKFLSLIMMSWIFVATTRPSEFSSALICAKIPYRYAYLPALAMRFVPIFELELGSVREAQVVRGLKLDKSVRGLIRSAKYTVLPMFFLAMFKVNSLAASMTGRGFGASKERTLLHPKRLTRWDLALMLSTVGMVVVVLLIDRCQDWPPSIIY
ncbi:MAG TPA: energy-coupling factor transporter transmembrane component T [Thermoplasmata archaeon]|nr:energy-coupling factor transporter transmembrane component T [Thermoplasmata archaeon]